MRAFTALTVSSVYNNPSGPAATCCPFTPRCFQRPPQLVCPQPHHSQRPHVFDFSFRRKEPCYSCTWQTVCDHRLSDPVKRLRDPALPGTPCSSLLCSQRLLLSLGPQLPVDTYLGSLPYHFSAAGSEPCWPYHFPWCTTACYCATPGAGPCWAKTLPLPVWSQSRVLSPYCPEMT